MAGARLTLAAVLFDVDFTLAKPGPDLGPDGYRRLGEQYGLQLDPARYPEARSAALASLLLDEHRRRQAHEAADASPTDLEAAATETSIEAAPGGDALAILDARYAAGEVVRRDYLRIRRDILGPNAAPS